MVFIIFNSTHHSSSVHQIHLDNQGIHHIFGCDPDNPQFHTSTLTDTRSQRLKHKP